MVHAMTEDLGGELRRLLAERGMSLRELARRVPCDPGNLSKIARGLKQPSPELAARFDGVLGSQGLLSALACQDRPAGQLSPDSEEDVRRRAFLGLGVYGGIEALRQRVDGTLDPVTTSRVGVVWDRATAELASEVGHLPPLQVLPGLLADLREAEVRLSGAPGTLRQRLARVCGQLAALTAITLCNLGEPEGARRYWRTAVRAADQSGDHVLQALLLGRRAVFALYGLHPASALEMAGDAITRARVPCAGTASGHAARAQALAHLGRHREAREALDDLAGMFTLLPDATTSDGVSQWGWSQARLLHVQSDVHSRAGCLREASAAQDAALALYPAAAYQGPAQVELHRALCLIAAGDPASGARHAIGVLEALPAGHDHDALVRRTAEFTLDAVPRGALRLPDVRQARAMLAPPGGQS
jgi:transcriptional regulator with XRE-family HTH domain